MHDTNREFEQLFAAHTNADLTEAERRRLYELAGQDVGRRGALAEVEAVHELVAAENSIRGETMRPAAPAEEADESYQRLSKVAAGSEERLRANLLYPAASTGRWSSPERVGQRSGRMAYFAAAAVLMIAAVLVFVFCGPSSGHGAPSLQDTVPDNKVLDLGPSIDVTTVITDDSPELSWSKVEYATTYDARILGEDGAVVLQRPQATERAKRFSNWQLTTADLTTLRRHTGQFFLDVVAWDKSGQQVGRTDKPEPIQVR